jgi:protein-tyrosine phosphatase
LAADAQNIIDAEAIRPDDATAKLMLMLDWVEDSPRSSVTDPYYGGPEGFAETWEDVSAVANALVAYYRGS